MISDKLLDLADRIGIADERSCDNIKSVLDAPEDIIDILLRDCRQTDAHTGNIASLFLGEHAAVFDPAEDILPVDFDDLKFHKAVVDKNGRPLFNFLIKIFVGD